MNAYFWADEFRALFDEALKAYRGGRRDVASVFSEKQRAFLATLGASAQEIFAFVEDHSRGGDPSFESALLVTAVRRDYFLVVQKGQWSKHFVSMAALPA